MPENTLETILRVEKEIQEMLDAEREKAARWLEMARQEIRADLQDKIDDLREASGKAQRDANDRARREAAQLLRKVDLEAEQLKHVDDDLLKRIVRQHVSAIVSGDSHDCSNVQD